VGKSAITVGGFVVRSNTTTEELPLATNNVFSIWRHEKPVRGGERVSRHSRRDAQHCAPGKSTEGAVRAKSGKRVAEVCEERIVPANRTG